MDHGLPARSRTLVIIVLASAVLAIVLTGNSSAVIPPCPVATDATVGQMAQQWAASFKDPYCGYLQERRNILLKQKITKGVFRQASELSDILRTSDEAVVSDVLRRIEKAARRINLKNPGIRELTGAKMRVMKATTALMTYAEGKKPYPEPPGWRRRWGILRPQPSTFPPGARHGKMPQSLPLPGA
jgi:hypothetical protein